MTRGRYILAGLILAAASVDGRQASPVYRFERSIATTGGGPHRLQLDVPVLAGAQSFGRVRPIGLDGFRALDGVEDLRLFDAAGTEVPYLQVFAPDIEPEWARASILPIAVTKRASGFEADLGSPRQVDAIDLMGLPVPFLKRLVLEGSGDRQRWAVLAAEGTLFDLPGEGLRRTTLAFVPGWFRYLRVTWDDTNSGRVPAPASVRARILPDSSAPRAPLTADVPLETRSSEPGYSRYRLTLPGSRLPIVALVLEVEAGHVLRQARVLESQVSGLQAIPVELGRETLRRVEKDGIAAEALRITIARPREAELDLVIDNGSNPPLKLRGASVEFAELPWIYFEAPAGPVIARYGNPSAGAPSYDLEAARESVRLLQVPEARWGEVRPVAPGTGPAAPPLPETGASIDVGVFPHARALPDGPPGLVALALDAAVLSNSRGPAAGFADVRIADDNGRQIPYLLERRDEPLSLDLVLRPTTLKSASDRPGTRSTYRTTLPYPDLPSPRLVLETSERVFHRTVQVGIERPPDRQRRDVWFDVRASGVWQHANPDAPAPALLLGFASGDATDLVVVVDEGDNRALPISRARLLLPAWRLRFFRPAGSIRLLYGRDDVERPRYDLALLAPRVMGGAAAEVTLEAWDGSAAPGPPAFVSPTVFWAGLVLAVLILIGVIARLVQGGQSPF